MRGVGGRFVGHLWGPDMQQEQVGYRCLERFEVDKNAIKAFFVYHPTADADDKRVSRDSIYLARTCMR